MEKEGLHNNSRYQFSDKKIKELFTHLKATGHEIGLHGTVQSAYNMKNLQNTLRKLEDNADLKIAGNRMHTLQFKLPDTMRLMGQAGIAYDSTLGFAAHEGFRNSYCYPFKLYDFDNDKIIDVWEYPLNVMDSTLTSYRKLSFSETTASVNQLITEVKKFGGIFTLLWHNCHFDEYAFPGITKFYQKLLKDIMSNDAQPVRGIDVLKRLKK